MNNKRKHIFKTLWGLGLAFFTLLAIQCTDNDAPELRAPNLTIEDVRNETRNSAVFSGSVYSNGESIVDECGFFYSSSESDLQKSLLTSNSPRATKVIVSPKLGKLETIIENLKAGTTYFYCVYAKSGKTMVVSNIKNFETPKESKPELNSVEVLEVTEYSIKVRSSIKDQGGASLNNFGFEYRKINETTWKGQFKNSFDEGSENLFTITLTNLEAGTEYVIRASATNSVDTNVSDEIRQKTMELTAPVVKTQELTDTDLGATWVKVMGIIENTGASDEIVNRGFCYSLTNNEPTVNDTRHIVESESNEFNLTITNLIPQTIYYLRAFAANKVDGNTKYGYGNVIMFETSAYKSTTFTEVKVDEIAASSAQLNCTITPGTGEIVEKGFCYSSTATKPEKENNLVFVTEESNEMKTKIEGLEENKKYYVRAFVTSKDANGEKETVYSEAAEFSTIAFESASLTDLTIVDITKHTAKATAVINSGTTTIVEKGFCWGGSNQLPDITNNDGKLKVESSEFTATLTGLNDGTYYRIRAYAICKRGNKEETIYSDVKSFTTSSYKLPSFSSLKSDSITKTSAVLSVTMTEGEVTIVDKGFCWNTELNPTIEDFKVSVKEKEFKSTISELKYNTSYYCRAYVVYKKGNDEKTETVYSEQKTFTTSSYKLPSFSSLKSDSITKTSAVLSVNMNAGEATIVEKGFCWGTSDYPTIAADSVIVVNGDDFRTTLSGLAIAKEYYYRAYATYKLGNDETETTVYSSSYNFTTKNYQIGQIKIEVKDKGLYSARVVAIHNMEGADEVTITEKGFVWSTKDYPTPRENEFEGKQIIEGDDFSCMMEKLNPGTLYYVRAYVRIKEMPGWFFYGGSTVTTFYTLSLSKPSFSDWDQYKTSVVEETTSSFTVKSKLYSTGNPAATEVGFCWTTVEGQKPEEAENKQSTTLEGDDSFTLQVPNLPSGTVYYVYAYAKNEVGTAYSECVTATIKRSPTDEDNANPDKIK